MSEQPSKLAQLNLVVADMAASQAFYGWIAGSSFDTDSGPHTELHLPDGMTLELDTAEAARRWHAGIRADPGTGGVVIGFTLASRPAVDECYADLTAAGYKGRQPPFDAFWGARCAIVADPDGNDVGLMSPVDETMRSWPPEQSPDL